MKPSNRIKVLIPIIIVILIVAYFFMYYWSNTDIRNVSVAGYVYDEATKRPLSDVLVIINNDRYEDDDGNKNYDEYLGHDEIKLYTDQNGFYSASIDKSAFIWIDFQKEGYINKREKGERANKTMRYKTYLVKQ